MKSEKRSKVFYGIYIAVCFLLFYLPIVVMMIFSFNHSKSLTSWSGFSLRWYERLINDGSIMKAVYVSVTVAIFATLISTVLGTITAIGLSKNKKVIKDLVLNINNIPIMNPDIVTAIGLMILFSSIRMSKGYMTMLLTFVISYFVTGNGVSNISIIVYNMTKRTNPTINALSTIVVVVIALLLITTKLIPAMVKQTMKKVIAVALVILVGVSVFTGVRTTSKTLRIFNAGEYIDPAIIEKFEKDHGCKIIYETFDSNESMYTKLKSGAKYDILIPSDYMIERLIKEEQIVPLDWSKIKNADGLNQEIMNLAYDPENRYSVPYFVGTVGILYNKNIVDEEDLKDGWELLRNTKYKGNIYMYDSERDSFMVALKALGFSMNTDNKDEINEAYRWLIEQRDQMDVVYVGDDVMDNMIAGNKALAVVYSGDGAYIMAENSELAYLEPKEGTNEWCDGMVLTKDCKDQELAYEFMSYMLEYDVAYRNSLYVGYTSPVKEVADAIAGGEYEGINAYVPSFGGENNEVFGYQDMNLKQFIANLWTKVKAY